MANILILGAGVMGTAFSFPLADTGQKISLVGTHLDSEWIKSMRHSGLHPKLGAHIPEGVDAFFHHQLSEALTEDTDLIVFGVSSPGIKWAVEQIGPLLKRSLPILLLTKGLAVKQDKLIVLPHLVMEKLEGCGWADMTVGGVGGPCIAGELSCRRHTSVTISCEEQHVLDWFLALSAAPYYHARPNLDLVGVEACAALKNFYALGVGSAAGLLERHGSGSNGALMHNLSSGLFTQALAEIDYLVSFLGGESPTVQGLAGVGDLHVTCLAGRNSRMGRLLGLGLRFQEAKSTHMPDDTIEGADLALTMGTLVEKLIGTTQLEAEALPLAASILAAICHNQILTIAWDRFYRH